MDFNPRHAGHWFEIVRTVAALAQVILTVLIALRVYGVV
jgi:hypothetical protein